MTQEEKAKAYDEAIERAKEVYDAYRFSMDTSNFNPTDIEYIFPQLAESEDEKIRKWLYDYIERVGRTWGKQPFHYEQILAWLERQKEQKPAEWSEEDEIIFQHCLVILHDYGYDDWFKSICSQPKQEWDEECKKKIVELKTFISMSKGFNKENRQKAFDMIDSLRPSWKPSKEQMEALKKEADKYWEVDGVDPLYTLWQDLQKL